MQQPLKTHWRKQKKPSFRFFCPLCHRPRYLSTRPSPNSWRHFFQITLTSLVFTLLFWNQFHVKGMVSFLPFWTIFEIIYRWRIRAILICSECGFDPYLFQRDPLSASRDIKTHWREKFKKKGIPYPGDPG